MDQVLLTNDAGQVRTITLNHPVKQNALDDRLGWAIVDAIQPASLLAADC